MLDQPKYENAIERALQAWWQKK